MSLHNHLLEDAERDLRQVEREMRRQMRLLDLHLQQLREDLSTTCLCSLALCPWGRRALTPRLDVEPELDSVERRHNWILNSYHDHRLLALVDVKGFDPKEVTVTVKDRKVKVSAEHEEEHATARGKEYNYKNMTKEIILPSEVSEDEVTYSLGPNSVMRIETAHKCYLFFAELQ
ncbi:heat shock protein beta-6-like [Antrostomus carolinensis]|uniref:heat shock protein beta-6-like n=1 Tax=Antrostomus carolinensis TaxID=279965 RepID=UPI0010A98D16|nr:heat shock protein beta-6-like [Antrostomus carolinensis]